MCLEDQTHMAEGFALALDIFEDLENRRRGNKLYVKATLKIN